MAILQFIIDNILTQAAVIIGLVACLGLVLQKKPASDVLMGTFKTMLGFLVLSAGSSVMQSALTYFGAMFNEAFGFNGMSAVVASIEGINGQAMTDLGLGSEIAICLAGIFIVNIIIARFSPFKYVFLTGQALLWESTLCVVFAWFCGLRGIPLIIIASIVGGAFATLMPAFAQPIVRKITDSDDIALGHFCTFGYMFTALVAKITNTIFGGKESKSTEDIEMPQSLSFLQDTYVSVGLVMIVFFLVVSGFAGPEAALEYAGDTNYMVYAFLEAMQFVVGLYVLLAGVRMLLAELVPAFQGISMKLVPDARPALDCPVLFTYAPNAVIFGFVFTTIGSLIGMAITGFMGTLVIPGVMSNFFAGGTAGIFGNAVDGRRGAIIGCIMHGIFIMILPALLSPMLAQIGFVNMTCTDVDTVVTGFFFMAIKSILGVFGIA